MQTLEAETRTEPTYDVAAIMGGLHGDGIIGLKGAFSREWARQLHEDLTTLYADALQRPGGALGRGPKRHYVVVLGVDAPTADNAERHDLQITRACYATLPESLKQHLTCRLVDALEPTVQAHTIEGLMMGEA